MNFHSFGMMLTCLVILTSATEVAESRLLDETEVPDAYKKAILADLFGELHEAKGDGLANSDGALSSIADDVSKLATFSLIDGKVRLDREHIEKEAEKLGDNDNNNQPNVPRQIIMPNGQQIQIQTRGFGGQQDDSSFGKLFQAIASKAGGRGFSSRSSMTHVSRSFQGSQLQGAVDASTDEGGLVKIEFTELTGSERALAWSDMPTGVTRIEISDKSANILILTQANDGGVSLVLVDGQQPVAIKARNLAALYREHGDIMAKRVLPVFEQVGVMLPPHPMDDRIIAGVLQSLRQDKVEEAKQAEKLIAELESDDFATREKAEKTLLEQYQRYGAYVQAAKEKGQGSAELMNRLESIINKAGPVIAKLPDLVKQYGLLDDAKYLQSILPKVAEKDRPLIERRLKELEKKADDAMAE